MRVINDLVADPDNLKRVGASACLPTLVVTALACDS
jgi:hypothetical protein